MASKPSSRRARTHRAKVARIKTSRGKSAAAKKLAGPKSSREKVRAYRQRMRAKGLRLVQMWVPDTRTPEFVAEAHRQSLRASRRASAALRQAWADALAPLPQGHATTFDDIADLAGSVDGLPPDLAANTKKYLRATGYGSQRSR